MQNSLAKCLMFFLVLLVVSLQLNNSHASELGEYHYGYIDRETTYKEDFYHVLGIYAISWPVYYLSQPAEFRDNGSFDKYEDNLFKIVFDNDEPFWNWIVHPYSGTQLYLYYRANGYARIEAFKMTFISSTLFEFFVEIYTEPASAQDIYQTPILGSLGGLVFEKASMSLLNSDYRALRIMGHILNPATLLWFYNGKTLMTPVVNQDLSSFGYQFTWQF